MKKTTTFLLGVVVLFLAACSGNSGFKKTKSGLVYKIISDGNGPVVKNGQFLKVHYTQSIKKNSKDSVLVSSFDGMPTYAQVDSVPESYNPATVFGMLRDGDSVVIVMEVDSIYKTADQRPPFMAAKDKLTLTFKVLEIIENEEALRVDQQALLEKQKKEEVKEIEEYLAKNNIQAQKTEKGTFVQIETPGTGPAADSGKAVHVLYTGKTFEGKVFDSNVDTSFGHPEPYVLVIGQRGAIEGWDDGLRLFRKGGKGKLYIPSMLAYGGNPPQGAPFKPFENLMFDIEVVDVTDAPAQQPGFPGQPPTR